VTNYVDMNAPTDKSQITVCLCCVATKADA
jgi:hypothetical protein